MVRISEKVEAIVARCERPLAPLYWPLGSVGERAHAVALFRHTIDELSAIGDGVIQHLQAAATRTNDRTIATDLLCALPSDKVLDTLLSASLDSEAVAARFGAPLTCVPVSESAFERVLRVMVEHPKLPFGPALAHQVRASSYPRLQALYPKLHVSVRRLVVQAVVAHGDGHELLEAWCEDRDPAIAIEALAGLALDGDGHALTMLIGATRQSSGTHALDALVRLGHPEAVPIVAERLARARDRRHLLEAWMLGAPELMPDIIARLDDRSVEVAETAAWTLEALVGRLPVEWRGRRIASELLPVLRLHLDGFVKRLGLGMRFVDAHRLGFADLVVALRRGDPHAHWNLIAMTGERHGYDPFADMVGNWDAWRRWEARAPELVTLVPGEYYYAGQRLTRG